MREADRLEGLLGVGPGAEILDVPCGGGRLALAFAERGYRLTGVDWSTNFSTMPVRAGGRTGSRWEQRDMRDLPWRERFDAAFCVGNSFGYLDDDGNAAFLRAVRAALKPGGRFVLETPMVLENLLGHLQPRPWWKAGDVYLLVENQYDQMNERLEIEYTFVEEWNGRGAARFPSWLYAYRELVALIESAGFAVSTAEPWNREAHMVSFVATGSVGSAAPRRRRRRFARAGVFWCQEIDAYRTRKDACRRAVRSARSRAGRRARPRARSVPGAERDPREGRSNDVASWSSCSGGGGEVWMQPPFFCDYGSNIYLGKRVFFNFNCVVLDVCAGAHRRLHAVRAGGPDLHRDASPRSRTSAHAGIRASR